MAAVDDDPAEEVGCRTREVLDIVGDKWSLLVVRNLRRVMWVDPGVSA